MTGGDKRLRLLLATLLVLAVLLEGVPRIASLYGKQRDEIARLEQRLARYRQLADETVEWQQRERAMALQVEDYHGWVLQGDNPGLASSSIQRLLRQAVAGSGVSLREMSVARVGSSGEWLVVNQDMSFTLDEQQILPFLAAIEALRPRLFITAFSLSHNRRQYIGNLSVTAFSRKPQAGGEAP